MLQKTYYNATRGQNPEGHTTWIFVSVETSFLEPTYLLIDSDEVKSSSIV
jgi:hypothetical protein